MHSGFLKVIKLDDLGYTPSRAQARDNGREDLLLCAHLERYLSTEAVTSKMMQ
jgi:hypothetical protein